MSYHSELCRAMKFLAEHPASVFMGQAVACEGTAMFTTLRDVPREKRIELPVAEEMQMGMATGAAIAGALPITIYPRWNFLLLAVNQLVNHLDKLPLYSAYKPKVIIRTAIATDQPLDPGPQHLGDFSDAFRLMLRTVEVVRLNREKDVFDAYHWALREAEGSTLFVERLELYAE